MTVIVLYEKPPVYDRAAVVFPLSPGVIFSWGPDLIYNPDRTYIGPELYAHEAVHGRRQGTKIDEWWDRYLADEGFRFSEEVVAHQAELRCMYQCSRDRNRRIRELHRIAARLASPLYGQIVTPSEARQWLLAGL